MERKLKDIKTAGRFVIIDAWSKKYLGNLPYAEAIEKYGDCKVEGAYTSRSCELPDANGKTPSWEIDVWIWIPGKHLGYANENPVTIPYDAEK